MKKYFILIILLINIPLTINASNKNQVNIYFFHSNTCSHCKAENKVLKKIAKNNSNIHIYRYEVHKSKNKDAINILENTYNITLNSVPLTIVGDTLITGYNELTGEKELKQAISYYSNYGYKDKLGNNLNIKTKSTYKVLSNNISYEKYLKRINYKILNIIPTKNLDNYTISSILGLVISLNPIFILSLILVTIILSKVNSSKDKLLLLIYYFILSYLFSISLIINNYLYYLILIIFSVIFLIKNIYTYLKLKDKKILIKIILYLIIILVVILINSYNFNIINIFSNVNNIYNINPTEKIMYYGSYLLSMLLVYSLLFSISYIISDKFIIGKYKERCYNQVESKFNIR